LTAVQHYNQAYNSHLASSKKASLYIIVLPVKHYISLS
jgi:hypothetical protein